LRSDRFAEEFVVEMDEGGFAELRFGDGVLGREPVQNMVATYRVGRGMAGNVGAEAIVQVMTSATAITKVRNPLPALGGVDPETLREVKLYAPQAFRVQQRAVTEADYAEIAERHPEVHRAVATRRWTGSWYTVFLTVERKNGLDVDEAFRDELADFMETYRLAGEDVEIEPPIFVPLSLTLVVCVKQGYFRDQVEQALLKKFSTTTVLSDGTAGFFADDQFTFGDKVYLSRVVGVAMSVPGVDWVDPRDPQFVFQRANELPAGEVDLGYIAMDRLEIPQCENSPSAPENGSISFVMMGGQ
jgi:predicted phage baseplate assembly protein